MTATIINKNANGIKGIHRDRQAKNGLHHGYKAVTIIDGKMVELVDLRISYSTQGTPYACIWLRYGGVYNSGSGTATGYGYHKASAAAGAAIRSAGVTLSDDIDGRGDAIIYDAVLAIGEALCNSHPVYVVEVYA